jgi:hypothetical protein
MLADRLPKNSLTFIERFGSRERASAYLSQQRWPAGFAAECRSRAPGLLAQEFLCNVIWQPALGRVPIARL